MWSGGGIMRVDSPVVKNVDGQTFINFESCMTRLIGIYILRC